MNTTAAGSLPRIVVIGAGFGGLNFCQKIPSHRARITVIDRQNHHLFQPLLYQVAAAGLSASLCPVCASWSARRGLASASAAPASPKGPAAKEMPSGALTAEKAATPSVALPER